MKRFGTFEGVFTPSILGILGVILYLRVVQVVNSDDEIERAETYLTRLKQLMRMPMDTEKMVNTSVLFVKDSELESALA